MKKNQILFLTIICIGVLLHESCTQTVDPPLNESKSISITNLIADTFIGNGAMGPYGAGTYTYFQLDSGLILTKADSNSTRWDLAFSGSTIKVNGGTSGPGVGGALIYKPVGISNPFNSILQVPNDSVFKTDNGTNLAIKKDSANSWYNYTAVSNDRTGNTLLTPRPGILIFIRTAKGKYAKLEMISYYKDKRDLDPALNFAGTATVTEKAKYARYYSFRYVYQANGTKVF